MLNRTRPVMAFVGGVALLTGVAGTAKTEENGSVDDLRARIADLESKLASLEAQNGDQWLTEQRAREIRGLVTDVLTDAGTRSSLLQGGATAGHDGNFFIRSADGNFHLEIQGQMQVRYIYNIQDDDDSGAIDTNRGGFENRRTKLKFTGHVFDPSWEYTVQGGFDRDGGEFKLEDAEIVKDFGNGWDVRVGQFKPPFMREELTSSKRQLAVARSLVNEEYNQDRSQGVELGYTSEQFRFDVMVNDGFGGDNVPALAEDIEAFGITGRGEFVVAGNFKQFKDFTSWSGEDFGLLLGAAGHYEREEFGTPSGPEEEFFTWTVDASFEFGGANLFGAFVGRHLEEADLDQFGFVVHGGFFLTEDWEAFARYEWSDFDTDAEDLNVVTVGVNRYFHKHGLKWTTDVGIGLDEVASPFASSGVGWRADLPDGDTQVVIRSQLQLLF